jgi:alkylation response protein AidB-like acyl-CoA dehydrogenase
MLEGDEIWCQLFSEPGAGSDLAGLTTRAEPDGDEFVITGQKIWTSGAHYADLGILLARTDPDAPKHRGISYFLFPMRQPGVDIRPIRQMTGEAEFCEVFLDGARVPAANLVGGLNDGWRVAITTLMNERISLSTGLGMLWGAGMSFRALWGKAVAEPLGPLERDRLTRLWIRSHILGRLKAAALDRAVAGGTPGVEAAIQKLLADTLGRDATDALVDLRGLGGLDMGADRSATEFLFARALTIGGGTEEVQKNILAERALGLPSDP